LAKRKERAELAERANTWKWIKHPNMKQHQIFL
jgi:hypothetical protein